MNYINVTDIYGNTIIKEDNRNSKLPFLLLSSIKPNLILEPVSGSEGYIYKLIYNNIAHILYYNNIDPSFFSSLGNIFIIDGKMPSKIQILLVNTSQEFSMYPTDFIKIGTFKKLSIWMPEESNSNYKPLGFVASKQKPSNTTIKIVNGELLKIYNGSNNSELDGIVPMNEFNLLGTINKPRYTIDKTKVLSINKYTNLNYNVQGELKLGNSKDGDYIKLNVAKNQRWYPYKDNIVPNVSCDNPLGNPGGNTCLRGYNNKLLDTDCTNSSYQSLSTHGSKTK